MFTKMINYIKSFFVKKEDKIWLLFGCKKIVCFANLPSYTYTYKECGHDETFLLGVYTSQTLAEHEMNNINKNLELSHIYGKVLNKDKYFACFVIPYQLNKHSTRLESIESRYHGYKIITNRNHRQNSRKFHVGNWFGI
jgi:hypothetical protein